jgi:ribosome-associated protein
MNHTFPINSDYIELNKLLKVLSLVESGWHAKKIITEWLVKVNGVVETRIRNKLKVGDVVQYLNNTIKVVPSQVFTVVQELEK